MNEYYVTFGNCNTVYHKTKKESLQSFWRKYVKLSHSIYWGDINLFYDGKLIRSVWNFNKNILNKNDRFTVQYNKY